MKSPLVSIIVRTKNEEKNIEKCLDSILNQTFKDYEILLIDAHSSDRTVEIAKKYHVRIIYEEGKKSYGHASNIGVKNAKGKYVAFISADSYADKKWLKSLVEIIEKDDKIAGVNGCIVKSNKLLSRKFLFNDEFRFQTINSLILKECIVNAGYFDESLPASEDTDIGWIIFKQGNIFKAAPKAVTYHFVDTSLYKIFKKEEKEVSGVWLSFFKHNLSIKMLYIDRICNLFLLIVYTLLLLNYPILLVTMIIPIIYYYKKFNSINLSFYKIILDIIRYIAALVGIIKAIIWRKRL